LGTHATRTPDHPRSKPAPAGPERAHKAGDHKAGAAGAADHKAGEAGEARHKAGGEPAAKSAPAGPPSDEGTAGDEIPTDDLFRLELSKELSGLEELFSDDFARVTAERDEYLDALQRLQADFNNHRRRVERQLAESRERANEALLLRLLPVLDALDLAMAHLSSGEAAGEAGDSAAEAASSLVQIHTLLRNTLAREGLERIDAVGVPFDPTIHEATAMDDSEAPDGEADEPAGPEVTEVWRPGYRMGDRVIRPAMVRVRK
jgi:molecular chaperone GrpE